MYYSLYPSKDTTITNCVLKGVNKSGSNSGRSEILELYVLTSSLSDRGKSRVLLFVDTTSLSSSIASGIIPSASVEYRLRLKHAVHSELQPASFDLNIYPLTRTWDEGVGLAMHDEELKDPGVANWGKATSQTTWTVPGGDFSTTLSASQHFDTGEEDLNVDISNIVYAFLTGGITNSGLILKFPDSYETGSSDFFVKKFYSRHAHRPERRPRLEALWNSAVQDDRHNIHYNRSGSLYYYSTVDGEFTSVAQPLFADIIAYYTGSLSASVVQTLTASLKSTGVYEISGVLIAPTGSTKVFRDVWFSSTSQIFTGSIFPTYETGSQTFLYNKLDISLPNLCPVYNSDQRIVVQVFAKEKDYKPALRLSASIVPTPILLKNAYYSIETATSGEELVSFSTGSNKYSKLSYDANGNYFELWTSSLTSDALYKIKILTTYNGQQLVFDKDWIIKVEK